MNLSNTITLVGSTASTIPDGATITLLDSSTNLSVTILVCRQTNNGTLKEYADGIINGTNPIISHDELKSMFGATDENLNLVEIFVQAYNLTVVRSYNRGANVVVSGPASAFNQAFGISLKSVSVEGRTYFNYIGNLSIPADLENIITHVIGLDDTLVLKKSQTNVSNGITSNTVTPLTPQQVASAYQWPAGDGYGQCVGIIELGGGFTNQNLTSTFTQMGIATPTVNFVSVDSATNNPSDAGNSSEVMLDIAVVGGAVPRATQAIYIGPNSAQGFVDVFLAAVNDTTNLPCVISCSWGGSESGFGTYATAMDTAFQSAAAIGIPVFVATGDYGSEYYSGAGYVSVQYPAASPYVTGCGGTTLDTTNGTLNSEVVWNQGNAGSAGGVSTIYSVPAYQTGFAVKAYPSGTVTTLTGRGIPDIGGNASPASGYQYYYGSGNSYVGTGGGTSATAPLYAGLVARLTALTGKRLGFLNTLFYNNINIFRDVTSGNNACPLSTGYSARAGWDACTGWGSIVGTSLYQLLHVGTTYPKQNYGFRPSTGSAYPRKTTGAR